MKGLLIAALCLAYSAGFAQNTQDASVAADTAAIHPGDGTLNGSFLKPCKNLWKLTLKSPTGAAKDMGTWSDQLEEVTISGKKLMKRTQIAKLPQSSSLTVNVFDPASMMPFSEDARGIGGIDFIHRNFNRDRVKTLAMSSDDSEVKVEEKTFDPAVFDFYGGMYGMLLVTGPLKEGYAARLPSIGEGDNDLHWVPYQVLREESVSAGSGKEVRAWLVLADTSIGKMKFWLTKEAPYVIRLEYVGAKGNTWIYEMI